MFGLGPVTRVYLAVGATDPRKGFEGLFGLVKDRGDQLIAIVNRLRSLHRKTRSLDYPVTV